MQTWLAGTIALVRFGNRFIKGRALTLVEIGKKSGAVRLRGRGKTDKSKVLCLSFLLHEMIFSGTLAVAFGVLIYSY